MMHTQRPDLKALLQPRSVAVVGATPKPGKTGRIVLENLRDGAARVYAIHPRHEDVLGIPAFPDLDSLPEPVDLVVVAVGAEQTVPVVEAAAARGVPFVIALAGGFAEAGQEGIQRQDELQSILRTYPQTRLLGPNTLGVQIPAVGLDTVFVEHAGVTTNGAGDGTVRERSMLVAGGIVLVSQSGSVAVEALGAEALRGFPLQSFIGLGNAVDLQTTHFLDHYADDPDTQCICVYLEHLGEGRALLERARRASARVPVFFLKAGRTKAGAAAAASHTGRLAGSDRVVDAAFRQFGIQRTLDDEALLDAARAVSFTSVPEGNRVAIVTPAGGYGVMAVDYLEGTPLELAELSETTRDALGSILMSFASTSNPVDLTAAVDTNAFVETVRILLRDPGVDLLIVMAFLAPAGITDELIERLGEVAGESDTSVLVFCRSGERTEEYCRAFTARGVPAYDSLIRTISAARVLVERRRTLDRLTEADRFAAGPDVSGEATAEVTDTVRTWLARFSGPQRPDEVDTKDLLRSAGIVVPRSLVLELDDPFHPPEFSGPYAVKATSASLLHKTEAGALRLNVAAGDLPDVVSALRAALPGTRILIEEMVAGVAVELIAGAIRDPDFGPALMVGAGGTLAELYRDTTFRLVPSSATEIDGMMEELTLAPLLSGYRGIPVDRNALRQDLLTLSRIVHALGDQLQELDVNPLCFAGDRWVALDGKIVLGPENAS